MQPLPTGLAQSCLIVAAVALSQILTSLFIGAVGRVLRRKARRPLGERSPRHAATPAKALGAGRLSSNIRDLTVASVIVGLILLSPTVAFLMVIAAEMVIDFVMEAGARTVLSLLMVGALGWLVSRKQSPPSYGASQFEDELSSEEPAPVPARPM